MRPAVINDRDELVGMKIKTFIRDVFQESYEVSYTLFKLMIPVVVLVKVLEELGLIHYFGIVLEPLMGLVGLPESMGIVWATTIMTNIYGGMIVFVSQSSIDPLSVAQVTVLGGMMLMAHSMPVEVRIAQKAGMSVWFSVLIRIGGGILYGWLLCQMYLATDYLQTPHQLLWQPQDIVGAGIGTWVITQLKSFAAVIGIIFTLILSLKILKIVGIESILKVVLKPILKVLGVSEKAITFTIVGITLGLSYGGGLLINEAQKGEIATKDLFVSIALLSVLHSLIEDTLLILVLGADISGVLFFRMAFAFIFVGVLSRAVSKMNSVRFTRYFCSKA